MHHGCVPGRARAAAGAGLPVQARHVLPVRAAVRAAARQRPGASGEGRDRLGPEVRAGTGEVVPGLGRTRPVSRNARAGRMVGCGTRSAAAFGGTCAHRRELAPMTVQDEVTQQGIALTDAAASKVSALVSQEGRDDLKLRVAVQPGGCSGLRYQLYFDERSFDGDVVRAFGGVEVVSDKMSAPYLMGATVDFVDTIEKQGFTIDNPNATGSCACGDSFH